jgi:hypothetical protein
VEQPQLARGVVEVARADEGEGIIRSALFRIDVEEIDDVEAGLEVLDRVCSDGRRLPTVIR